MSRKKKKGGTCEGWTTQFRLIPALGEMDREKGVNAKEESRRLTETLSQTKKRSEGGSN